MYNTVEECFSVHYIVAKHREQGFKSRPLPASSGAKPSILGKDLTVTARTKTRTTITTKSLVDSVALRGSRVKILQYNISLLINAT